MTADIKFMHQMFAKYKDPRYLEIAKGIGTKHQTFDELWTRKVNEGCDRRGIPRIYG